MSHPLLEMQRLGQSPWHDNIERRLLTGGGLKRMVKAGDITGLTSNPTIFQKAISDSSDYDEDLKTFAREGLDAREIFYRLAIDDLREAADVFRPIYDRTAGMDGYVSLECAPDLAYDQRGTIAEAKRLWEEVDRPNLMVKIPATPQGVPAIERCIAAGININVTLIFDRRRYAEVMDAYLKGLEQRHKSGKPVSGIASVASFFVSRVDGVVDAQLEAKLASGDGDRWLLESLAGKAAIANAKLAYQDFRKKFVTERFATLSRAGAMRQRPLWASTSTKNPRYPDTYYVDALIGTDSVDTLPPATLKAFKDHGQAERRIDRGLEESEIVMNQLARVGIDMKAVTQKLEDDGVKSFADSFDDLIETIEKRRKKYVGNRKIKRKPAAKAAKKPAAKKPAAKAVAKKKATAKKVVQKVAKKVVKKVKAAASAAKRAAAKATAKKTQTAKKSAPAKAKKVTAKKKVAKSRPAAKKAAAKKSPAKVTKKAAAKRVVRKKVAAKKPAAKKPAAKKKPTVKK